MGAERIDPWISSHRSIPSGAAGKPVLVGEKSPILPALALRSTSERAFRGHFWLEGLSWCRRPKHVRADGLERSP
jgi:hypothetical protein